MLLYMDVCLVVCGQICKEGKQTQEKNAKQLSTGFPHNLGGKLLLSASLTLLVYQNAEYSMRNKWGAGVTNLLSITSIAMQRNQFTRFAT